MMLLLAFALTIPQAYLGVWAPTAPQCAAPGPILEAAGNQIGFMPSDGFVEIRPDAVEFYALRFTPIERRRSRGGFAFLARGEGEGEESQATLELRRAGPRLTIAVDGDAQVYVRCPGAPPTSGG